MEKWITNFGNYIHSYNELCKKYDQLINDALEQNNKVLIGLIQKWFKKEADKITCEFKMEDDNNGY